MNVSGQQVMVKVSNRSSCLHSEMNDRFLLTRLRRYSCSYPVV